MTMIEGQQFCMSFTMEQRQNRRSSLTSLTSIQVQADTRLLVVRQHPHGQDVMFSCPSHSKAFRKWPFQAMTFNDE